MSTLGHYLAVGSVVIEDGSSSTAYKLMSVVFPEPQPDGMGGHEPAVRTIGLRVEASTVALVKAAVNALRRECVRDNLITWQVDSAGTALTSRIREAYVVEEHHDPLTWGQDTDPYTTLTLTLTTDPYWLAPWSDEVDASGDVSTIPGHFDVPDPGGEVDALVSMRLVPVRWGRSLYVGVKPDPGSGYDYLDDYGASGAGTADSNAYGGYKLASSGLDSTLSEHWAAPAIDTHDNRGRHIAIARMDTNAASSSTCSAQARVTTSGYNITSADVSVDSQETGLSQKSLFVLELGTIQVPAGAVPTGETGSGYVEVTEGNAVDDGTLTLTSSDSLGLPLLHFYQEFAGFNGDVVSVTYTVDQAPSVTLLGSGLILQDSSGNDLYYITANPPLTVGTHTVSLATPYHIQSGRTYRIYFGMDYPYSQFTVGFAHSNGDYASGALTMVYGTGASAGDDLTFTVAGRVPLGINTSNPILAACTESGKAINLDYVQRIPSDYACIVRRSSTNKTMSLYYDGDSDTAYNADSDGIGPAILDEVEIRRPLRVKPGVTNRVVLGLGQANDTIAGAAALTYRVRPRYLSATG